MARNLPKNARRGYGVSEADFNAMANLIEETLSGNGIAKAKFVEAISTSDSAAYVLADVATSQIQANYDQFESTADKFATYRRSDSFRGIKFHDLVGDFSKLEHAGNEANFKGGILPVIPELSVYPEIALETAEKAYEQSKRGARVTISWEAWREDPYGILQDLPNQLASIVPETEDWYTTEALLNGVTAYSNVKGGTAPDGTTIAPNAPLSLEAVSLAMDEVKSREVAGRRVQVSRWVLMVSPELVNQAKFLANLVSRDYTVGANTYGVSNFNPMSGIEIVENVNVPSGFWALVPAPNGGSRRIAVARFGLAGHEQPELRVENATGTYKAGGGAVAWSEGSFVNDSLAFRLRHVGGAGLVSEEGIVWSTSTGTAAVTPR